MSFDDLMEELRILEKEYRKQKDDLSIAYCNEHDRITAKMIDVKQAHNLAVARGEKEGQLVCTEYAECTGRIHRAQADGGDRGVGEDKSLEKILQTGRGNACCNSDHRAWF